MRPLLKSSETYKNMLQCLNKKSIEKIRKEWIKIENETKIPLNSSFGELFEVQVASLISEENYEISYDNHVVKGSSDGGIDVIKIGKNKIFFIQTKLKEYDDEYIRKMIITSEDLFKDIDSEFDANNKSLKPFVDKYFDKDAEKKEFEYIFIGTSVPHIKSIKQRFPRKNIKAFNIADFLATIASKEYSEIMKQKEFRITFNPRSKSVVSDKNLPKNEYFSLVKGVEFIKQFTDLNDFAIDELFEKNIRNKVTTSSFEKAFINTIDKEPEYFHLYNNGLTIVSESIIEKQNSIIVYSPQVVNGQQTLRTLINIYKTNKNNFDKILIPIRAIEILESNLATKIARYSNNQTAVKESELNFISSEYRTIQNKSKKYGYILKGRKGKLNSDSIMLDILEKGELPLNELIRSHSSAVHPSLYLGASKNSISSVVKEYFNNKNYINSLLKEFHFENSIKAIENYREQILVTKNREIEKYKNQGIKYKKYRKKLDTVLNPYKFGISVYYNVFINTKIKPITVVKDIYNNYANKEINLFKNNLEVNEALKKSVKKFK